MKLSPAQVEKTVSQLQIEAIPDSHSLVPQLNRLFGEHTYFIDKNGLNIVEPATGDIDIAEADASGMGVVVNVAHWTSANPPKLEAHDRSRPKAWCAQNRRRRLAAVNALPA